MEFGKLPASCKAYVPGLIVAAAVIVVVCTSQPGEHFLSAKYLLLLACAVVVAPINIKIPKVDSHFAMDSGFVFALMMLFGLFPAVLAELITKATFSVKHTNRTNYYKLFFNVGVGIVSIYISGLLYFAVQAGAPILSTRQLLATFSMVIIYFLLNTLFVALAVSLSLGISLASAWPHYLITIVSFLACGSIAILVTAVYNESPGMAIVMALPIVILGIVAHHLYNELKTAKEMPLAKGGQNDA